MRRPRDLARCVALCEQLDTAERDAPKARAALLIARYSINRLRLASLAASARGKR